MHGAAAPLILVSLLEMHTDAMLQVAYLAAEWEQSYLRDACSAILIDVAALAARGPLPFVRRVLCQR